MCGPVDVARARRSAWLLVACVVPAVAACGGDGPSGDGSPQRAEQTVEAVVTATPVTERDCGSGFRAMTLDHVVEVRQPTSAFDANGAGVAVGDLDEDGRADVVLGNLDGPIRVFWNRGGFEFDAEILASGRARSVQLVDVDGDDDLDVVTGPGFGPPLVFTNTLEESPRTFRVTSLPGVTAPAYSMVWFDPDADLDLDAVVAAYDMEWGRVVGGEYVSDGANGVWFVEQSDDGWQSTQLADLAHALAVTTVDLDDDGDDDLVVGNDYGVPDGIWLWDGGWTAAPERLSTTAANTMSFDVGDVDADGDDDLYATDMAPFDDSNQEIWQEMAAGDHDPPGPQLVENVLVDLGDEATANRAPAAGLDATGWSWSGRLFDADQDGDLDALVVNGMLPSPLFPFDDPTGLVEPNLAYRNDGAGSFERADDWGLDSRLSTRGAAAADLDGDGDLDVVTSTVGGPAQLFVNELCEGASLTVEPRMPGNTRALGAEVTVRTAAGVQTRTIRSGIGYLSADPPVAHFGLGEVAVDEPVDEAVDEVVVRWPDGEVSVVDDVEPDTRLLIERAEVG